jgi:Ca2+/Na+ antiporter
LAYSNLLGSCIANILGGLGLGLLFLPSGLEYDFSTKVFTATQLAITTMASIVLFYNSSIDRRLSAALFYATFVIYVASTLRLIWNGSVDAPEDSDDGSDDTSSDDTDQGSAPITEVNDETTALLANRARSTKRKKVAWLAFSLLVSAGVLSMASYFITTSLIVLCNKLHITETTAGLTILSFITTIPEKAVAIKAGRRAQAGVILASTAGSNIFLLTLCLGVVMSFPAASQLQLDGQVIGITLACSVALTCVVFLLPGRTRWIGSTLLLCYCAFLFFEVYKVPLN